PHPPVPVAGVAAEAGGASPRVASDAAASASAPLLITLMCLSLPTGRSLAAGNRTPGRRMSACQPLVCWRCADGVAACHRTCGGPRQTLARDAGRVLGEDSSDGGTGMRTRSGLAGHAGRETAVRAWRSVWRAGRA